MGRIKSIATIPAISTHLQQGEEGRNLAALPSNLIRLAVGNEHPSDIIQDLDQALSEMALGKGTFNISHGKPVEPRRAQDEHLYVI